MIDPNKFWITNPKYNIIIANKGAEESIYRDPRVAHIQTGEMKCKQKGCSKMPQTVCEDCVEYVCEEHLHRHPDCANGR